MLHLLVLFTLACSNPNDNWSARPHPATDPNTSVNPSLPPQPTPTPLNSKRSDSTPSDSTPSDSTQSASTRSGASLSISLEISRLNLNLSELAQWPTRSTEQLKELDLKLKDRGISLDVERFYNSSIQPVSFDQDRFEEYLKKVTPTIHPDILLYKRKIAANLQRISYPELKAGLLRLTHEFLEQNKGKPYSIGFRDKKSSFWLASLVQPLLPELPETSWSVAADNILSLDWEEEQERHWINIKPNHPSTFVLFDDASYSGMQLKYVIKEFAKYIEYSPLNEAHLFIIIPFLSSGAKLLLETSHFSSKVDISVHILSTTFEMTCLQRLFKFKEYENLFYSAKDRSFATQDSYLSAMRPFELASSYEGICLSYTDWKLPDNASFIPNFIGLKLLRDNKEHDLDDRNALEPYEEYIFIPNFKPIYK